MIQYPMSFEAQARANAETASPWMVSASGNDSHCAIPAEFGGNGGAPSPEDFYALALTNCYIATFKVFAKASNLTFSQITVRANLILDKGETPQPFAKKCALSVVLEGASDVAKASLIVKKVARTGILLNSVKTELNFDFTVNGEQIT